MKLVQAEGDTLILFVVSCYTCSPALCRSSPSPSALCVPKESLQRHISLAFAWSSLCCTALPSHPEGSHGMSKGPVLSGIMTGLL